MTAEQLDKFFKSNISYHLSDEQRKTIKGYTGIDHRDINNFLKGIEPYFMSETEVFEKIRLLRSSIRLSRLPEPMVVYHGTGLDIFDGRYIEEYLSDSSQIFTKTFLSTSIDKQNGLAFGKTNRGTNRLTLLKIYLPSGYPALWMKPLSINKDENELLLANYISFNIFGYDFDHTLNGELYQIVKVSPVSNKRK